jgi:hypothetical protein
MFANMMRYLISVTMLLAALSAHGQAINCDSVYIIVEQMAIYKNGIKDFYSDFGKLKLTKGCRSEDLTSVSWIVNTEGQMIDIEVRALNDKCGPLILKQLNEFPRWTPAKHGGRNVCLKMTLPVHLRGSH